MYRKPIFDAVRVMLKRGFSQDEVEALDRACDVAEAALGNGAPLREKPKPTASETGPTPASYVLGRVSEEFESGGRGPGTVSGGENDPGGVSYGVYQLASKTGTCAAFLRSEGKPWAEKFAGHKPGTQAFTAAWKASAAAEPEAFRRAQHGFIERTHYRAVVNSVAARKGVDLDERCHAVRDAAWSCAVQHAGAPMILIDAIDRVERETGRDDPQYDRDLIEAIYKARAAYVLEVARNPHLKQAERDLLVSITVNRYPRELTKALAMLDGAAAAAPASGPSAPTGRTLIDGNAVARANGVGVKSSAVKIGNLHPSMEAVIVAVAQCAREMALPRPVITSGNDSRHMKGSLHFVGRALDFRGNNLKIAVGRSLRDKVAGRLGADYDVLFEVFENPVNNHLHVEYDPD